MSTTLKFGQALYTIYTRQELEVLGLKLNPNMHIGAGWFFCVNCNRHNYFYAMSHSGRADCFEVCRECNCHSRRAEYGPIVDPEYYNYINNPTAHDPRD